MATLRGSIGRKRGFSLWPLLLGRFQPRNARIDGLMLTMVRRADGPNDWSRPGEPTGGGVTARASSPKLIDAVIEAGLFSTQSVKLTVKVRPAQSRWVIDDLRGSAGRSDLAGRLAITREDGGSRIDGWIVSRSARPTAV